MNISEQSIRDSVLDYCLQIGSDPMLVQGAGGNVSWKDEGVLWIKSSGTWLKDAREKDLFVSVDLNDLKASIDKKDFKVSPKIIGESKLRPSIETLLHALMPQKIVVHVHAIDALSHLVRLDCEVEIKKKMGSNDIKWSMVEYNKPGAELALEVSKAIDKNPNVQVLLLKNHGVVIGGKDIDEVKLLLNKLLLSLKLDCLSNAIDIIPNESNEMNNSGYQLINHESIQQLAINVELFEQLEKNWVLYPDHLVFLGAQALCYSNIDSFNQNNTGSAELIFIKGLGVFSKGGFSVAKLEQLLCFYHVLIRQKRNVTLKTLDREQIAELLNWDAERYRQDIAK